LSEPQGSKAGRTSDRATVLGRTCRIRTPGGCVAYRDLREFVRKLEKEGELRRIRTEVDPILEITEIVQRMGRDAGSQLPESRWPAHRGHQLSAHGKHAHGGLGPALLFEKPRASRYPLLINAFGSVQRMCLAFEVATLDEVAERVRGLLDMQTP